MLQKEDIKETIREQDTSNNSPQAGKLSMDYVLEQIEKIASQTGYLEKAIQKLGDMADGDNGECGSPGNIQGQAKAQALGDVVRCRETTNQQLIHFYEKIYDSLNPKQPAIKDKALEVAGCTMNHAAASVEEKQMLVDALADIRHIED